jgi:protein MpaA
MMLRVLSRTHLNLPILAYDFGKSTDPKILILGGIHGDETEGVACAKALLASFLNDFPYQLQVTIIPEANPDGCLLNTRTNSKGVDLNRNLPTKDWSAEIKSERYHPGASPLSEVENQALVKELNTGVKFVLSLHSWKPVLNINGDCLQEAETLSQLTGYAIDQEIGYPTPGCLGTFAGLERNIPTLTYEIERGLKTDLVIKNHVPAILEMLKVSERIRK